MTPIIAIVGRPNVGKSTLFNRIIGTRKALALNQPGVSRDRHYARASWDGREFICVDTGGFPFQSKEKIGVKIQRQIEIALAEADVIWLVLDAKDGLLPGDAELDVRLRKLGKEIFRIVNKVDSPLQERQLGEFHRLGEFFAVSAEQGAGISALLDESVKEFPTGKPEEVTDKEVRVALIGRPNVGKSSLLNRLIGEERVVVDEQPGTTRDVIDTLLVRGERRFRILDTAGIRRGGQMAGELERFSVLKAIQAIERSDICLLLLDAKEGISRQDAHVAGYAAEAKKGIVVLWNKWDLVNPKRGIEKIFQQKMEEDLPFLAHAPLLTVSALTGWGAETIWPTVEKLHQSCGRRIKTAEVNRVFEQVVEAHNRPVYKGAAVKFLYATQTSVFPPTFIIFVNEPKGVHFSYRRYLVNRFRAAFGFGGAPIEILFRQKK